MSNNDAAHWIRVSESPLQTQSQPYQASQVWSKPPRGTTTIRASRAHWLKYMAASGGCWQPGIRVRARTEAARVGGDSSNA